MSIAISPTSISSTSVSAMLIHTGVVDKLQQYRFLLQIGNFAVPKLGEEEALLDKLVGVHQQDLADPTPQVIQPYFGSARRLLPALGRAPALPIATKAT